MQDYATYGMMKKIRCPSWSFSRCVFRDKNVTNIMQNIGKHE